MPQRQFGQEYQHAEQAYRAGYQRGARDTLARLDGALPLELRILLKHWIEADLHTWRMKDFGKQTPEPPPPPPAVRL